MTITCPHLSLCLPSLGPLANNNARKVKHKPYTSPIYFGSFIYSCQLCCWCRIRHQLSAKTKQISTKLSLWNGVSLSRLDLDIVIYSFVIWKQVYQMKTSSTIPRHNLISNSITASVLQASANFRWNPLTSKCYNFSFSF